MIQHRPAEEALIHRLDADATEFEDVSPACAVSADTFESARTFNRYDTSWSFSQGDAQSLNVRLTAAPAEIPVPSMRRGFLISGCQLEGTLLNVPIRGSGCAEIFGQEVNVNRFFWGMQKTTLATRLESFMPRAFDPSWFQRICMTPNPLILDPNDAQFAILDPIWSMMDRGGKGWRSTWLALCLYALSYEGRQFIDLLPVIELLHTGSLVIDDIQDQSRMRRGKPALHEQIGTDLAINVGNFLYFLPLILIQEAHWLSDTQRLHIFEHIATALRQGHIGQGIDLMWSKGRLDTDAKASDLEVAQSQLLEQYRLKSGSQLESIARIAGTISQAPPNLVAVLADYSRVFGVVFQIVDDLIDVQEGFEKLGKDEFEDLKNGRLNMVLLHTLCRLSPRERRKVIRAMNDATGKNRETIRTLISASNAEQQCIALAEEMIEKAWTPMAALPATDAKIVLRSVPKWLLEQRRAASTRRRGVFQRNWKRACQFALR
ncbi:MAG: polyprenyl synthetase family protein [Vicinamibacteria bacterium]|nr:polyprenyl synthetase family protein [Vicinamibacteria bacterium]